MAGIGALRVGLDLTFLGERAGGVGRYALELAAALAAREDVVLHCVASRDLPSAVRKLPWAESVRWSVLPIGDQTLGGPRAKVLGDFTFVPALALWHRWDVLHSPANAGPVRVPKVACLITMHDVIWLHADSAWGTAEDVRAMHRVSVPTVRRARRVIAVSQAAADELITELGLDPARLDVTPQGVTAPVAEPTPEEALRLRFGLGDGAVILCVAQKRPYKNQGALVRALARLQDPAVRLVLPGSATPYEDELRALADGLGVANRLVLLDWVSDADLEGLYALASCVVLPSRFEGFGLPVLEAMARGKPVACSAIPSLMEVAGDAALTFDPDDGEAVHAAIARLLDDTALRDELSQRGRARAALFTWAATADATVAVYRRALGRVG